MLSLTPVSPTLGNVTVLFAAVGYAGTLRITAALDRSAGADQALLLSTLQAALNRLAGPP